MKAFAQLHLLSKRRVAASRITRLIRYRFFGENAVNNPRGYPENVSGLVIAN